MRPLRIWILVSALAAGFAGPASADRAWMEIQSPHFTIICNGSEKEGREAAVELERMRTVLMKALPSIRKDPNVPIIVFVTNDEDTFAALVPTYRQRAQGNKPDSMFQRGRDRNYIVMREVFRGHAEFHLEYDYAGLMAAVNFRRAPIWLLTGFAEFFAQSEITEDQAKVGMPNVHLEQRIRNAPVMPIQKVLTVGTSSEEYKDPEKRWVFEADSWGLVHYLLIGDQGAHRPQLEKYLQLLMQGKKRLDAAEEAFGNLEKLQDKLTQYCRQMGFPFSRIALAREDYAQQLHVRSLPAAESNAWLAEYQLRFKRQEVAKPLIDAALAADPNEPRAHEAQGLYDLEQGDYENALKEFSAAAARDSSFYLSYYYKGILSSYWKPPGEIPESGERDLLHAMEIAPRYAPALMGLARLIVRRGGSVTQAVMIAERAVETEPSIVRYHLAYANILLLAGNGSQAEKEAQQALENQLSPLEELSANAILKLAEDCKPGAPCKALGLVDFTNGGETPTAVPPRASSTGAPATEPATQLLQVRGVIRSISCAPEGRVVTLTAGGKDLTFNAPKPVGFGFPETFWLGLEFIEACKNLAGEPARIVYKAGAAEVASPDATAVEVQDRY